MILPNDECSVAGGGEGGDEGVEARELNLLLLEMGEWKREEVKLGAPHSQQIHDRLWPSNLLNAAVNPPTQLTWYQPKCWEASQQRSHWMAL